MRSTILILTGTLVMLSCAAAPPSAGPASDILPSMLLAALLLGARPRFGRRRP